MKKEMEGSITVLLSLVLLLVLAVIMTTIEAARVKVANVFAERALITAMDSVLAEYYLPLFEEYHIFALDSGYGTETAQVDSIIANLDEYMEYTFEPNKDLYLIDDFIPIDHVNLFEIGTKNLRLKQKNTIMDYEGNLFVGQAVSYMKYKEIGNGLEGFLQKLAIIKDTKAAKTIFIEKQKVEESIYSIDKGILGLMRLIDGISISEKGVKTNRAGKIIIKDNFVKKICLSPATKGSLGIENDLVFSSLEGHYILPLESIDLVIADVDALVENLSLKDSARITYLFKTLIDQSEIKNVEELKKLHMEIQKAREDLELYTAREETLLDTVRDGIGTINGFVEGTLGTIQSSFPILDDLIIKQSMVTQKINEYESILLESQEYLSSDLLQGLSEDLVTIKKYKTNDSDMEGVIDNYDFQGMKNTLINNEAILVELQKYAGLTIMATEISLDEVKTSLLDMKKHMEQYSHSELHFDYSSLTKPEESDDFFDRIKALLEDGIMGLVVEDMEDVSKKELTATDLPTNSQRVDVGKEPEDITSLLSSMNLKSEIGSISDFFNSFGADLDLVDTVSTGGDVVGRMLLLQEYLIEHFGCYSTNDMENSLKTLDYELEYIIMGGTRDYNNLKAVIMRILLIRTIMNLVALMGDSQSRGEARTLAIGFVGFTGLPALVSIVKTLIISVWAFEESLIDVAALLQGKMVPLLKNKSNLQLSLTDLFAINKAFIKSKVASMKDNVTLIELGYQDYLRIFLFLEGKEDKSYRAMDLIQENLQIMYEDTFYIKNCILSFQIDGEFQMKTKFVTLPFVKQFMKEEENTYVFKITKEYAY